MPTGSVAEAARGGLTSPERPAGRTFPDTLWPAEREAACTGRAKGPPKADTASRTAAPRARRGNGRDATHATSADKSQSWRFGRSVSQEKGLNPLHSDHHGGPRPGRGVGGRGA